MSFKEDCEELTKVIESCFDWENDEDDGLTFDERLQQKLKQKPNLRKFYDEYGIGNNL